jgi:nucleotide-binding universal stress UspA family protein
MMSHQEQTSRRLVVGVDGSEESRAALRWAADEADLRNAELEAVLAWERPYLIPVPQMSQGAFPISPVDPELLGRQAERTLHESLGEVFGEQLPARLKPLVLEGNPAGVLLSRALNAELLIVGSRGHGGFKGLLTGSVTEQCVRHARSSVVVVRPSGGSRSPAASG